MLIVDAMRVSTSAHYVGSADTVILFLSLSLSLNPKPTALHHPNTASGLHHTRRRGSYL